MSKNKQQPLKLEDYFPKMDAKGRPVIALDVLELALVKPTKVPTLTLPKPISKP